MQNIYWLCCSNVVEAGIRGPVSFSEMSQERTLVLCSEFWAFGPKGLLSAFSKSEIKMKIELKPWPWPKLLFEESLGSFWCQLNWVRPRKKEMRSEGKREGKRCGLPEVGENSPRLREARGLRWFPQRAERILSWKRRGAMTAGYRCRFTVELWGVGNSTECWDLGLTNRTFGAATLSPHLRTCLSYSKVKLVRNIC